MNTELILGGARSGKSRFAEQQAIQSGKRVIYIATATAGDDEMASRIVRHQQDRPADWQLVETPIALAEAICAHDHPDHCLLVDCLTLWLTNCLFDRDVNADWPAEKSALLAALQHVQGRVVLVSNEVGQGIVPMGEMSRLFVDESGWLHQDIARQVDRVTFVTAGLPQVLKDNQR
ncbi:bifunctional adenosylcobinamide kinase/adenosylcobinamide-phosphate guanylyltransferase [Photobacterium japonica]|uniref:bifunctional adenosylcobinamide kinase/adenosylcobinamide-phosphate guanylyltransferase n=1 Tax=Photobacterium japonica TaxID=2910235 RepID=UPI003D0B1268